MKDWKFKLEVTFILILWLFACNGGFSQSFFSQPQGGITFDSPVELGTRFTTSANATINGLRFFKANAGTQNYVLKLYSGNTLITSANYQGTVTGFINVTIPATSLIPGVVYTVSYYSPGGVYQAANPYAWPVTNGPLTATGSAYRYGGGFPNQVFQTSNYFADLVLQSSTPPPGGRDTIYIRDTIVLPSFPPDSSLIVNNNGVTEKYYWYFVKQPPIHDTIYINLPPIRDTVTIVRVDTFRVDNYLTDTLYLPDTIHALYGWDAYDSTNYLPHYKDFKIVELPTFDGKRIRYVHKIVEAIRREEWDDVTGTWIEK